MNFALGTASTDVKAKCMEVLRHIEDNLRGEFMTSVQALVSPEFFDQLTSHDKVVKAYERWRRPGNAGGGKGHDFWRAFEGAEDR